MLSDEALLVEWKRSVDCLSEILGRQVRTASVPGGFYTRRVAAAAVKAGVTDLFTSEPVVRMVVVEGCRVYGRYSVQRGTGAETAAALAAGRPVPRLRQWVSWNGRKLAKAIGGRHYIALKNRILASREGDSPPVDGPA